MTSPEAIDLAALRAAVIARSRDRTHCPECYLWSDHRDCAIMALLDRLAAAEAVCTALKTTGNSFSDWEQNWCMALAAYDRAIAGQEGET